MNKTKIQLSAEEMKLVQNAEWILTKNRVIEKVYTLFGELAAGMQAYISAHAEELPEMVVASTPKISKGEQYEGLPYVMLDYPRCFGKEEILAVRTFFWWGNYFSSTLHVKGAVAKNLLMKLGKKSIISGNAGVRISDSGDEWSHTMHSENYMSSQEWLLKESSIDGESSFLKLAMQFPLQDWATAPVFLNRYFEQWMELIKK
jgi:hypothetical protein